MWSGVHIWFEARFTRFTLLGNIEITKLIMDSSMNSSQPTINPRHASMSHMLMAAQLRGKKQRQRGLPAKSNDPQYDHFNKHMSLWGFSRLDSGILYNERNCFNTPEGQDFVHSPFWVFQCSDRSCKQSPYCVSEPACSPRLIILIPRPCVPGATFVKGYHFITNSFS